MISPTLLNQDALGRPGVHFHTGLRINLDVGKAMNIKDFLYGNNSLRLIRLAKRLAKRAFGCLSERFAKVLFGLNKAIDLGLQGL